MICHTCGHDTLPEPPPISAYESIFNSWLEKTYGTKWPKSIKITPKARQLLSIFAHTVPVMKGLPFMTWAGDFGTIELHLARSNDPEAFDFKRRT